MEPKYPQAVVDRSVVGANAFEVLGKAQDALVAAGAPRVDIDAYLAEATSGGYQHLITTTRRWVRVVGRAPRGEVAREAGRTGNGPGHSRKAGSAAAGR